MRATAAAILVVLSLGGGRAVVAAWLDDARRVEGDAPARPAEEAAPEPAAPLLATAPPERRRHATDVPSDGGADGERSRDAAAGIVPVAEAGPVASDATPAGAPVAEARVPVGPPSGATAPSDPVDPLRPRAYDVGRLLAMAPDARALREGSCDFPARSFRLERLLCAFVTSAEEAGRPPWEVRATEGRRLVHAPRREEDVAEFEALLDRVARVGGDALSVHVAVFPDVREVAAALGIAAPGVEQAVETPDGAPATWLPAAAGTLDLDVPADHRVRAFEGTSFAYLSDYDVEISMAANVAAPIVAALDVGLGATGLLEEGPDGTSSVGLEIAWSAGRPEFPTFSTSLCAGTDPWVIELPSVPCVRFDGHVPARPNSRWLLGLTGGAGALVTVGGRVAGPPSVPAWRSVGLTQSLARGLGPIDRTDPELLDVALEAPEAAGGAHRGPFLWCEEGQDAERLGLPGPAFEATGLAMDAAPSPSLSPDARYAVGGGVRLDVSAQPDEGGSRAFDVALDLGAVVPEAERVVSEHATDHDRLRLPAARHTVVSFRLRLAHGETVVRDVVAGVTGRPERWTLSVTRR